MINLVIKNKNQSGFTLIELLVVISIIALLSTLAVVALNNARIRSRDAKRLSDMNAVFKAMQLYADGNDNDFTGACKDGSGTAITLPTELNACVGNSGSEGIDDYLPDIANLIDPSGTGQCVSPATGPCNYTLSSISANSFVIDFWQEGGDGAGRVTENGVVR